MFVEDTCRPVLDAIGERPVAIGGDPGVPREARAIDGVSPHLLVAIRAVSAVCGDGARWVGGVVHVPDRSLADELVLSVAACRSLQAPHRDDQSCEEGGPARHQGFLDEDTYAVDFGWFPQVVQQVNADLAGGVDSPHADPTAAIADFERRVGFPDCWNRPSHLQLCRIGHAPFGATSSDMVVVEGVTQTRNADVGFDSQAYAWTVEQLGGGPGWWVTRRSHQPSRYLSDLEAEQVWEACCSEVVVTTGAVPR